MASMLRNMLPATRQMFMYTPTRFFAAGGFAGFTKLFVGNLSWNATSEDLASFFGRYGEVREAFILQDRETGRSRGMGFVHVEESAADKCVGEGNGAEFMGRQIRVEVATPMGERPRREPREEY